MTKLDLTTLTTEELEVEAKKRKKSYLIGSFIIGMMFGCAFWSAIKNGLSLFLLVPFVFAYWFKNTKVDYDEIKKEIAARQ